MKNQRTKEIENHFIQEFLRKWNPTLKVDTVIAEIAIEAKYSLSYVKKALQPIGKLKMAKQYVVGEILELLEDNVSEWRLHNEYPLNHIYLTLAPMDNNEIITDPMMCVHIEKILRDEDL